MSGTLDTVVNGVVAGLFIVAAASDDGPVIVAVARDAPGLRVAPSAPPLGLRAAGLADVTLQDVLVPTDARLDAADLQDLVAGEQLLLAVAAVAGARAAVELTVAYVRDRRAFGAPIASFQNTRQMLGDVAASLEAAQALVDLCLADRAAGRLTATRAAAAKLQATHVHDRAVDAGVQLHGGYGYMLEYPIARAFADACFLRLHGGTSQDL